MPRPLLPADERRTPFRVRLNKDHRAALQRIATRYGCSLNEAVIRAIVETDASEEQP